MKRPRCNMGKEEAKKALRRSSFEQYRRGKEFLASGRKSRGQESYLAEVCGRPGSLLHNQGPKDEPLFSCTTGLLTFRQTRLSLPGMSHQEDCYQLEGLRQLGREPIPLCALLGANGMDETLPPRSFVVTFDDGYEISIQPPAHSSCSQHPCYGISSNRIRE
jgi:hypothetical protein